MQGREDKKSLVAVPTKGAVLGSKKNKQYVWNALQLRFSRALPNSCLFDTENWGENIPASTSFSRCKPDVILLTFKYSENRFKKIMKT